MSQQNGNNSGVYQIVNKVNGHKYIGSSVTLRRRLRDHFKALNNGGGSNIILKNAANKYGVDNLEFQILLYCDPENCIMYEQMVMDTFHPKYNISPTAGSLLGFRHSEESKQKMIKVQRGRKLSDEARRNIGNSKRGFKHSEETKKKMSKSQCARMRFKEERKKVSDFISGRKLSEAHKKKVGDFHRGKKLSNETKKKLSVAHSGKILSEKHKNRISTSLKAYNRKNNGTR